MKVKDKFINLFASYHLKYPDNEFISGKLDPLYNMIYGEKYLTTYATKENIDSIVDSIYNFYDNKWTKLYTYYNSLLDSIMNGGETVKREETGLEKSSTTNLLASYDDDTLQNSDSSEYEKQPITKTTTTTDSKLSGYKSRFDYLQSTDFYDIIFTDVNKLITLDIYRED